MNMKSKGQNPMIQEILAQVLERLKSYNPEKVILFGSLAEAKAHEDSDLDLLIIKDTTAPPLQRMREAIRLCRGKPPMTTIGIDCLVYTPSEVEERLRLGDPFITRIIARGKVIYEREQSISGRRMVQESK